ncbi:MAG: ABC transporter permease [Oscillospiraceae bacterium]|nr:ABC transporter permease [Oscillospiraceae bacterium]
MRKRLYNRLAWDGIGKNWKLYFPYILSCVLTIAMYYMIKSLALNDGVQAMRGGDSVVLLLGLGSWVVMIFAVIFLFYTNSFLMKRRKKEFGLYNVLGMEKRHLCRVIFLETLYIALISLGLGLLAGMALGKLMFLLLTRALGGEATLGFHLSGEAIVSTLGLFAVIFFLILLNSLRQVRKTAPIELLKAESYGEREPKAKWLLALLGALCLGAGYAISQVVDDPIGAMFWFFVAVVLVIIGTYLLFTAGSIALLKLLQKNKRYYYKARHFVSVSGMMYRMKRNAVGLANICILATMVLVMISTTASLVAGAEQAVRLRYPYDLANDGTDEYTAAWLSQKTVEEAAAQGAAVTEEVSYSYLAMYVLRQGEVLVTSAVDGSPEGVAYTEGIAYFITLEDYNRLTGESRTLAEDEILLYVSKADYDQDTLTIFDRTYTVADRVDSFLGNGRVMAYIYPSYCIVVRDEAQLSYLEENSIYDLAVFWGANLDADDETTIQIYQTLRQAASEEEGYFGSLECQAWERDELVSIYNSFFFLGVFLSVLFMIAAILVIYYKQISEGYEDRRRFEIMQQVGMSRLEVKRAIRSQVLTVFFLPLAMAGVHELFAMSIILQIMDVLMLASHSIYYITAAVSFALFAAAYAMVYGLTARTYYRIVSPNGPVNILTA